MTDFVKKALSYFVFAVGIATLGFAIYIIIVNTFETPHNLKHFNQASQFSEIQHTNKSVANLYFANKENSFLTVEKRVIYHSSGIENFGNGIIKALIDGPTKQQLIRSIPANSELRAFYVTQDGIAYVDMMRDIQDNHSGGIKSELITIYSIVNSLILNIPEINSVKILIEGREAMTLMGHIDTRFPFKANMLLVQ